MAKQFSAKRLAIDKAEASLVLTVGIATFVVMFCLVASWALVGQMTYQNKVISQKKTALKQLNDNIASVDSLAIAYEEFANAPDNVLGGSPTGRGDKDGPNSRIVLDALPSKYDFPALATSLEKLLKDNKYRISNISGTDEEISQAALESDGPPQPIEIPFSVTVSTSPGSLKTLIQLFERSIRPIQIQKLTVSGQNEQTNIVIDARTYYQPELGLNVRSEVVK